MTIDAINLSTLNGLRVAITGGTSGLGLALVEGLRRGGADVAFVARNARGVKAVVRDVPGAHGIDGDVSRKEGDPRLGDAHHGGSRWARRAHQQRLEPRAGAPGAVSRH